MNATSPAINFDDAKYYNTQRGLISSTPGMLEALEQNQKNLENKFNQEFETVYHKKPTEIKPVHPIPYKGSNTPE
jgi:hypothetical protein